MTQNYKTRRAQLDCLYDNIGSLDDPCVYCGSPSMVYDHVPPLHYVDRAKDEPESLRKYPACSECNSALSGLILLTLKERRKRIREYLRKKYKSFLSMPRWSEDELSELEPQFADEIRRASRFAEIVKLRVSFY